MLIDEEYYKNLLDYTGYEDPSDIGGSREDEAARNFSIALRKVIELEDWDALSRLAEETYSMEEFERHYFYEQGGKKVEAETLRIIHSKISEIDAFAASLNELKGALRMAIYFDEVVKYPDKGGNVTIVFNSGKDVRNGYITVTEEMIRRKWDGACNGRKISEHPEWEDMYLHVRDNVSAAAVRYEMTDSGWIRLDEGILITEETFPTGI